MKKIFIILLGCVFVLLALVFFVIPGPSIIFALAALVCFAIYYPFAGVYLKKTQKIFKNICCKLDKAK
tara:strand:- start:1 stop:204 length:204 start_codon:yes stop_codon:yes gene_type:complete